MFPTKHIPAKHKLRFKKNLGQNLLTDAAALEAISACASLDSDDHLLEIGPGPGNLSVLLAPQVKKFYAVEKDLAFKPLLTQTLEKYKNSELIFSDILKFSLKNIYLDKKLKIIGNLPFYITSPILKHLIEQKEFIEMILITVQKEVAQRIIAAPGSKNYGRLSCLLQFYTRPQILCDFPKELFMPRPEVNASLVRLDILDKPAIEVKSPELFFKLIKAAFAHRRKTLLNSLLAAGGLGLKKENLIDALGKVHIPANIRGENLSLLEFGKLADVIYDK